MVQIHLGQPIMDYLANGNKWEFAGPENFVAQSFVGRWSDRDLIEKEEFCYSKIRKLNKGDEFIITSLKRKNDLDNPTLPEKVAMYCPKRNFSFLLHSAYFEYHYFKVERKNRYHVNKNNITHKNDQYKFDICKMPIFRWISSPETQNPATLWNILNEHI
jgi:hypothetical protein